MKLQFKDIPLSKIIMTKEYLVRPDKRDLKELVASLKHDGMMVPVMVVPNGTGYHLVAGNRRMAAARTARLKTVPAMVITGKVSKVALIGAALRENVCREQMTQLEIGNGIARLLQEDDMSERKVAKIVGMSQQHVNHLKQLSKEPLKIQTLISGDNSGRQGLRSGGTGISEAAIRMTRPIKNDDERVMLLKAAKTSRLNVKEISERAKLVQEARSLEVKKRIMDAPAGATYVDNRYVTATEKDVKRKADERARKKAAARRKKKWEIDDEVSEVAAFLREIQRMHKQVPTISAWLKAGKFSPEGKRFAKGHIGPLVRSLTALSQRM